MLSGYLPEIRPASRQYLETIHGTVPKYYVNYTYWWRWARLLFGIVELHISKTQEKILRDSFSLGEDL